MAGSRFALVVLATQLAVGALLLPASTPAQDDVAPSAAVAPGDENGEEAAAPDKVDVAPLAEDAEIAERLERILSATGWFRSPEVRVDEGVVFLSGTARDDEVREWAANVARRTQDVVAVVNRIEVERPSLFDLEPAMVGLEALWRDTLGLLPFLGFAFVVFLASWGGARLTVRAMRSFLHRYISAPLLRDVLARAAGVLVFLVGVYIVLRISGLTRLAMTVIGGTGILGLIIGIAFRDITENFLASIFLSMKRPFLVGDLVEITGELGFVQSLTTRTTVLLTLSGNQVEIPNSVVFKNRILNYSTNRNRREDFTVGIGYEVPIAHAQDVALGVLRDHPAVLDDPEPWALVDSLGSAVVVLRIYFWLDGSTHSWLKVKSSVIRLVKRAFQDAGISMPDEAREIVFPDGVPVRAMEESEARTKPEDAAAPRAAPPAEPPATNAEGGLSSEAEDMEEQARKSRPIAAENLLGNATAPPRP